MLTDIEPGAVASSGDRSDPRWQGRPVVNEHQRARKVRAACQGAAYLATDAEVGCNDRDGAATVNAGR